MDLTKRTITSATWNYLVNFLIFILVFIRQAILARILPFETFGIYAYTTSIVYLTLALPDMGMGSALLNRAPETEDTDQTASVYFTLKAIFTALWALIMLVGGYFLMDSDQFLALGILVLAKGLDEIASRTARTILIKQVTVRRIAVLRLISMIFSFALSIVLALLGAGIWALLVNDILFTVIMIGGLYFWRPFWKPHFIWIKDKVRYFLDLGRKNLLAGVLAEGLDRLDDVWTGFFLGEVQMAFYSKAYNYANMPKKFLGDPLTQIIRGSYAELKGDRPRLSKSFFFFLSFLLRTGFFVSGLLFITAPEFITIVLGERWLPMLTAFQLMLIFTLINPIKIAIGNLFISVGQPEMITRARVIQLIVMVGGLFTLGNLYGITGVAVAVDLMVLIGLAQQFVLVRKFVDYSIKDLFLAPTLALFAGLGLVYLATSWIQFDFPIASGIWKSVLYGVGFMAVFLAQEYTMIRDDYFPLVKRVFQG